MCICATWTHVAELVAVLAVFGWMWWVMFNAD
jgi:hypothetical protein